MATTGAEGVRLDEKIPENGGVPQKSGHEGFAEDPRNKGGTMEFSFDDAIAKIVLPEKPRDAVKGKLVVIHA